MRLSRPVSALRRETSGVALIEFAIAFPTVLALGMYGIDSANLALTSLKLNQVALNLADNASRVGSMSTMAKQQMRIADVDDIFQAAKSQGAGIKLETNGKIVLSSLEKDSSGVQRLHWQRCFGNKVGTAYDSHYGKVKNTDGDAEATSTGTANIGVAAPSGMGDVSSKVTAPSNDSGVMFVEVNYHYTPMFSWLSSPADLRYVASFIVRDKRDFSALLGADTSTLYECGYGSRVAPA